MIIGKIDNYTWLNALKVILTRNLCDECRVMRCISAFSDKVY